MDVTTRDDNPTSPAPGPGWTWDPDAGRWMPPTNGTGNPHASAPTAPPDTRDPYGHNFGDPDYGYPTGTDPYWDKPGGMANAPPTSNVTPPPPPPNNPGGAPGLSPWGRTFDFTPASVTMPTLAAFKGPDLPVIADFKAPAPFAYTKQFTPPTAESILADGSYDFRKSQGEGAMLNSDVAQGIARSGGTLKDFIGYNQNFASQEYKNIFDRDLGVYQMDRANAADEYDRTYKQLVDEFDLNRQTKFGVFDRGLDEAKTGYGGDMTRYTTETNRAQRQSEVEWQHAYDQYVQSWNEWKQNQDEIMWTYDYQKSLV